MLLYRKDFTLFSQLNPLVCLKCDCHARRVALLFILKVLAPRLGRLTSRSKTLTFDLRASRRKFELLLGRSKIQAANLLLWESKVERTVCLKAPANWLALRQGCPHQREAHYGSRDCRSMG